MDKNSQMSNSNVNASFVDESRPKPKTYYICNECGKYFAYERVFKSHVNVAHKKHESKPKPKKFGCNECGKYFADKEILKSHVDVVHAKYYTLDVVQQE